MAWVTWPETPALSVTVNLTAYVLAAAYVCWAFFVAAAAPSPKSHL